MVLAHDISKGERTQDVKINQNITFETMLLAPNTMQGLRDAGFYKPSPIQLYGIPIGKCGFDLLLEAKSGTGKTAVFSVIALEKLDFSKGLQVVILTPTREIAAQICDVLKQIGSKYEDLEVEVVIGGLPFQEDIEKFKKTVHIVVGSPGRLRHLIQNKHIDTSTVRLLVLDEADKLMEKSFQADIQYIHSALPKQKQVIMSSATYSESSKSLINNFVHNANHVCPDSDRILLGIEQKVTFVKFNSNIVRHTQDRFKELLKILVKIPFKQCLVFCNYQARVSEVHKLLKKEKWPSEQLYGQQEQHDRLDALKTLQQYKCRILVSTDLAARGIDASNIDLVVNFESPYEWRTYLHRIGRAGRYGSYGLAVTILSEGGEQQRFKNMFNSMEPPINIHYLWAEKELIQDNSVKACKSPIQNQVSTKIPEEVQCEDTCEMLNSKSDDIIDIQSFENLFVSQKKIETKIEPFSDLMLSLNNEHGEENREKYLFKHIEMKKLCPIIIPFKNIHKDVQNTTFENDKNIFDIEVNENDDNNIKCTDNVKNSNISEANKEFTEVVPNLLMKTKDNAKNIVITEHKIDTKSLNNEIIDLDLPTMFSSSKLKKDKEFNRSAPPFEHFMGNCPVTNYIYDHVTTNKKVSSQMQNNEKIAKTKQDANSCYKSNNMPKTYTKVKLNNRNVNKTESDEVKKIYEADCTPNSSKQNTHSRSKQKSGTLNSKKCYLEDHNKDKAKLYNNWYGQLKIRMNMVQQAIYVDEMSRL